MQWTFIDEVAAPPTIRRRAAAVHRAAGGRRAADRPAGDRGLDARALILQRRSALALDGVSSIAREPSCGCWRG